MNETDKSPIIGRRTVSPSNQVTKVPVTHVREQEYTPIVSRRKVDFRNTHTIEAVSLLDKLPPELQEVLDDINPDVLQEWRRQAMEAAHYIHSLDLDQEITDANKQPLAKRDKSLLIN